MYSNYNYETRATESGLARYIAGVFGWMFIGLMITAFTAFFTISSPAGRAFINFPTLIVLSLVELGLVIYLSGWVHKMSSSTATILFLIYSAINGVTLSTIFFIYEMGMISKAFGVTAVVFGVMAIYGYFTKTDLTHVGGLFIMGIVGIIIASIINIFLRSTMMETIISYVGLFLFLGLVAYDTQKIKSYFQMSGGAGDLLRKGAIISALALYLDFINIFLFLLRIFGGSNKD